MPKVAAIVSAPKTTTAVALTAPQIKQATSDTPPAAQSGQPATMRAAQMFELSPSMEPIDRSTTPDSSANPANAATSMGIATNDPMIVMLLGARKLGPIQVSPTITTSSSATAIEVTEPVAGSRNLCRSSPELLNREPDEPRVIGEASWRASHQWKLPQSG